MIESVTLPLSAFDLPGFIAGYQNFHRNWSGDASVAYLIVGMRAYGETPSNFLDATCSVLEGPMMEFVNTFVRK